MRTANFFDDYNKALRRLMWSQFLQQVELENERRVRAEAYRDAAKRAIDATVPRPQDR